MLLSITDNTFCAYINLRHRTDRREKIERELDRVGLSAHRAIAIKTSEHNWDAEKFKVMLQRTPNALGCFYSQYAVIKEAHKRRQHAMVLEDDLVICSDWQERVPIIEQFCNTHEWDIMFLGCCHHQPTEWHKSVNGKHTHPDMQLCNCALNADAAPTDNKHIIRAYGVWSTHAYIVNYNSIPRILKMLDDNVHLSMGIDWLFMYLSPNMNQYAFVPGCVKQYDNQSDIGTGITEFSAFKHLGPHWFADRMDGFDYDRFYKNMR